MARLAYTDLKINFTPTATTRPNTTEIPALIVLYYQQCYRLFYGPGHYSSDETTDTDGIIDSDDFRALLNIVVSYKVQRWQEAGTNSDGSIRPMPVFDLSFDEGKDKEERQKWITLLATLSTEDDSHTYWDTVKWIGSDYGDWEGVL